MKVILILILWLGSFLYVNGQCSKFTATAYSLRGQTATGMRVREGYIAADPRVLKLHKIVMILGLGTFVVEDTGSRIKGKKIDIWMSSKKKAIKFGRRIITICRI